MKYFLLLIITFGFPRIMNAQDFITRDIHSFGAIGDGKTNDQYAFEKAAAFFNARGGNGKLLIPSGTYIVGKQEYTGNKTNSWAFTGSDILHFKGITNFNIEGSSTSIIKYKDSLLFGSFDPKTKKVFKHTGEFYDRTYAAVIGYCIFFDSCNNISVNNLELDGNTKAIKQGGGYGNIGTQLSHDGIFIMNSRKVLISNVSAHHFSCDGICLSNIASPQKDQVTFSKCSFEYNARQGFSWVGGNDLHVIACKFNHTGQGKFYSPPGAGVDIESEIGPVENGSFEQCEFIDNIGAGLTAVNGSRCSFNDCTFWGIDNWSAWVTTPAFTFTGCRFYGSTVWGYNSPDETNATKYINCVFEDKPYNGKEPYGNFLIESNETRRVSYTNCTFIAHKKNLYWLLITKAKSPEEKYRFTNCTFILKNQSPPKPGTPQENPNIVSVKSTFQYGKPANQ